MRIGIVGGGPAGAYAAWQAAEQGHDVTFFDHRAPWEKPCGGGITVKAQDEFPWIGEIASRSRAVSEFRFRSPSDREVEFVCPRPTLIFARSEFDESVRERARAAGARQLGLKVQSVERGRQGWLLEAEGERFEFNFLVGADGAISKVRETLLPDCPAFVNSIAAGFFIPAQLDRVETKFFADTRGYLWFFPRSNHLSVGLCLWGGDGGRALGRETRERLLELLDSYYPDLDPDRGKGYGAFIPTIMDPACWKVPRGGTDWALVGDAGGFVDAITGEGIFYALRSARAWSRALAAGRPDAYDQLWRTEFGDELSKASSLVHRFYHPGFIEHVIGFGSRSASVQDLLSDLVMGTQSYVTLRRRLRREIVRGAARRMSRFLRPAALAR
jgi:flavin-dependent dehydrogenase